MTLYKLVAILGLTVLGIVAAQAQEKVAIQSDEVIARVNGKAIMRSIYHRFLTETLEEMKAEGFKDQALETKFEESQAVLVRNLISQELLVQRASELSIEIAPEVVEQLLRLTRPVCTLRTDESWLEERQEVKHDINDIRGSLRRRLLTETVLDREVYETLRQQLTQQQKREYYEKHKEIATKPFEAPEIQQLVTYKLAEELGAQKIEAYLEKLRRQAVIEINPNYRVEWNQLK